MLITKKKENLPLVDSPVQLNHKVEINKSEKMNKNLDRAKKTKKSVENVDNEDTIYSWCSENGP